MTQLPELQPGTFNKGQRLGVALLICITVLLIAVSVLQFKSSIYAYGRRGPGLDPSVLDPEARAKNEEEALKKKDTDGDGLSDYDELNIYRSSPYLKDMDSDGVPDGEEVRRGTSPVCPEGKDCSINPVVAAAEKTQPATSTPRAAATSTSGIDLAAIKPADIREALLANGVSQDVVDELSDEELLELLKEAATEARKTAPQPKP